MNSKDIFKVCSFVASKKENIYEENEKSKSMIKS